MVSWVMRILLIVLIVGLCSCSASWHVRKAMKKDPSLFSDTTTTVTVDTVILETPTVDTVFRQVRDTLIEYIQTDSVGRETVIQYLWNTKTDSVFIEVDCPDQEIVEIVKIKELPPIVLEPTLWQQIKWFVVVLGIVTIIIVIRRLIK